MRRKEHKDVVCERDLLSFLWQIFNGMAFGHRCGVILRGLAARNILLKRGCDVLIADFGLSIWKESQPTYTKTEHLRPNSEATPPVTACFRLMDGRNLTNHILQVIKITTKIEYRKAFSFFDANNDGFISADELNEAMRKCGQNPSRLELKLIMYHGDLDQNGVITFDEFTHLMDGSTHLTKYTYSQLLQQFQMFDRDRDGFIEKHEMYECVKELSLETSFPTPVIEQLFSEADVDGDGKISFDGRLSLGNEDRVFRVCTRR